MAKASDIMINIGAKLNPEYNKTLKQAFGSLGRIYTLFSQGGQAVDKYNKKIQKVKTNIKELNDKIDNKENKLSTKNYGLATENTQLSASMQKDEQVLAYLKKARNTTEESITNKEIERDKSIEKYEKELAKLNKTLKTSETNINKLNASAKRAKYTENIGILAKAKKSRTAASSEVQIYSRQIKEKYGDRISKSKDYEELSSKLETARTKLKNAENAVIKAQSKVDKQSDNYAKNIASIEKYNQKIKETKKTIEDLKKSQSKSNSEQTKDLQLQKDHLSDINNNIKIVEKSLESKGAKITANKEKMQQNTAAYEEYKAKINESIDKLSKKSDTLFSEMSKKAKNVLKNVILNLLKSIIKLAKKFLKDMIAPFKALKNNLIDGKKLMRMIIQYGFGFRSLYYLVNKFKAGISEGFGYLGKAYDDVQQKLNKLKELLLYLKSASAAALAPLLNVVTALKPVLEKVVALFNKFAVSIATIIAQLTGQDYIYVATTDLDAYANALDDAADSADGLNKALGAYDKLNIISQDKGSGSSDLDTSSWFTKQEIESESWATKFAQSIEDGIKKLDLSEVGNMLGEKIKSMFDNIHWTDWIDETTEETKKGIETVANEISTSLATLFIGLFSTEDLGKTIGENIAHAFNVAIDFVSNFLNTEIDGETAFSSFGDFLIEGINSLLQTLNIEKLGETIRTIFDDINDLFIKFITEIDSDEIATILVEVIKTVFNALGNKIDLILTALDTLFTEILPKVVTKLTENLPTIKESLQKVIMDFVIAVLNAVALLPDLINAVIDLFSFKKISAEELDNTETANAITESISEDIKNVEATEIGKSLGEALAKIDFEGLGGVLREFAGGLVTAIGTAISTWCDENPDSFKGVVASIVGLISLKLVGTYIKDKIVKWLAAGGLTAAIKAIGTWLTGGLGLGTLLTDIGVFFTEIAFPAIGAMLAAIPIWGWIVAAAAVVLVAIIKNWDTIKEWVDEKWSAIKAWWTETVVPAFDNVKAKLDEWKDRIIEIFDKIKTKFDEWKEKVIEKVIEWKEKFIEVFDKVKEKLGEWKDKLSEKLDAIKTKLTEWKDKVTEVVTSIKDKVVEKFTNMKDKLGEIFTKLKDLIKKPINAIIGFINGLIKGVVTGVNKVIDMINSISFTVPTNEVTKFFGIAGMGWQGFNLRKLDTFEIPKLAQGAVIPPNKEFLATLGDQSHGTNIEAPLDTIKQALAEVMMKQGSGSNQPIILQVDGKTLAKVVWNENEKRYKQIGKNYAY